MARNTNGVLGTFNGKIGPVVGYLWKDLSVMRSLPKKRASAPTAGELLNQKKFALTQAWLRPLTAYVRVGFKGFSPHNEGFTAAKSWLSKNALKVENGIPVIHPELAKISFGDLPLPSEIKAELTAPRVIKISWSTNDGHNAHDQVMVVAYEPYKSEVGYMYGPVRITGECELPLEMGKEYHVYASFTATDRTRQSDSVYLGKFMG